jgi:hypothetical protein
LPKRYLTGGGRRLKNHSRSTCYHSNIFNNLKYFTKELAQFLKPRNEEELSRGVVLIEFAVCMPVLIILLFYINDLVRLKRYYSQTEFVAQQAANMIQNISQKRGAEDPTKLKITKPDLQHIFTLATLTIYPDNNFCSIYRGHKYGHFGEIFLHYIKGNDNGTADVIWRCMVQMYANGENPYAIGVGDNSGSLNGRSHIKVQKGVSPQQIWPTLKIGPGEKKIIVECCIDYTNTSTYKLGNGDGCNTVSPSKIFGFNLIKPKGTNREDTVDFAYFNSVVIFTPKSGLFTETAPQ